MSRRDVILRKMEIIGSDAYLAQLNDLAYNPTQMDEAFARYRLVRILCKLMYGRVWK